MRRRLSALLALAALVGGSGAVAALAQRSTHRPSADHETLGERVRVQVVNATTTRGLGRRAMLYLRDRGFDVVDLGTSRDRREVTVVIDRSGRPERAKAVAAAFGAATIESRRDSSRYLDVTVLVGRSWRPPAEPFYP